MTPDSEVDQFKRPGPWRVLFAIGAVVIAVALAIRFLPGHAPPNETVETATTASAVSSAAPPEPKTPRMLTMEALQPIADEYAPLDAEALPSTSVTKASGRKVVFVLQRLDMPDMPPGLGGGKAKIVWLPRGFDAAHPASLALTTKDVGVVVLMRETDTKVGTYSGGKEAAMETRYDMTAVLVPEKTRIGSFSHVTSPPGVATRIGSGKDSVLVGNIAEDDERWISAAADELANGRLP